MFEQLTPHAESYEDVGVVQSYLFDMHPVWETRKHRLHTVVKPEKAVYTLEQEFPLPPALLWEYLTKPEYRTILYGADSQRVEDLKQGRIADGSVYVCAHGKNLFQHSIVDWHPFEQYTIESATPAGGSSLITVRLTPHENKTIATVLFGKVQGLSFVKKRLLRLAGPRFIISVFRDGLEALGELIEGDINQGKVTQQPAIDIPVEQIESAQADSLAKA